MNVPAVQPTRQLMPISNVFAQAPVEDLGEGIRAALASLSINQNRFSIRHRKEYHQLPPDQMLQVEVVILRGAKTQSKSFYGGFTPGSDKPPICWSSNSLTPDHDVPTDQIQNSVCATCRNVSEIRRLRVCETFCGLSCLDL